MAGEEYPQPPAWDTTVRRFLKFNVARTAPWRLGVYRRANPDYQDNQMTGALRLGARDWVWCLLIFVGPVLIRIWRWEQYGMDDYPPMGGW